MSYSDYVLKPSQRTARWSLTMAWWALFSAMFWLYIAVASANAVGMRSTLIGIGLTIATYGAINAVLSRYGARTGLTVELLSRSLFGTLGSALATLIFAATAIYYAVFEGSIVAAAFKSYFGGDIRLWYLAVVLYALPLVSGGVQNWLDRLNGVLLPLYVAGLVAAVIATLVKVGAPHSWPQGQPGSQLPGWLTAYLIYMGVYIMMMYTFDYARLGREEDAKFHARVSFGWVFYLLTFAVNGLVGIFLVTAWGVTGTESGVVDAMIRSLGLVGVVVIFISQTRINTANYFLASTNLQAFATRVLRLRLNRLVWVVVSGAIAYALMLTDVISYLIKALAWQGVFVTAWVGIALAYILVIARDSTRLPELRRDRLQVIAPGAAVWVAASALGIYLIQQHPTTAVGQLAPLITLVIAGLGFLAVSKFAPPATLNGSADRVQADELDLV